MPAYRASPLDDLVDALDHAGLKRQLVRGETHRFFRHVDVDAGDFEQHAAGAYHCYPAVHRALTGTHAYLCGLLSYRLVREDANPHLAATTEVVSNRTAGGLDLTAVDP